eukprot:Clim_evm4s18 gene=Clim_evmTU4s18
MYSLFKGIFKLLFHKDEYCVLILGLDNAGKTTLVEKVKSYYIQNYKELSAGAIAPTIGLNVAKCETQGVKLIFWDLGGQKELHTIWDKYYQEAHGLIYVVDSADRKRIPESWDIFSTVITSQALAKAPILVLANKQDLDNAMDVAEMVTVFEIDQQDLGDRHWKLVPSSATSGDGVKSAVDWMVTMIKRNRDNRPPKQDT